LVVIMDWDVAGKIALLLAAVGATATLCAVPVSRQIAQMRTATRFRLFAVASTLLMAGTTLLWFTPKLSQALLWLCPFAAGWALLLASFVVRYRAGMPKPEAAE
jgi:hypothetical protein